MTYLVGYYLPFGTTNFFSPISTSAHVPIYIELLQRADSSENTIWKKTVNVSIIFDLLGLKTVGRCYDIFPTFRRHLCAASSGVVLPVLFSGRRKGVGLQRRLLSSTSSPLGYCCWGSLSSLRQLPCCSWGSGPDSKSVDVVLEVRLPLPSQRWPSGEEIEERRRRWSPTPFLLPLKSAGRTTPEDAAHRWRRNVGKTS